MLRLRKTKVNQFSSSTVSVFGNGTELCPVISLSQYLTLVKKPAQLPLFWISGKPLSSSKFNSILKLAVQHIGLNPRLYSSHSLRSGAATTAASRGVSAWLIQKLGRWSSGCYKIYISKPTRALLQAHREMAW